jgi:hypothetical protein
MEDKEQLSFRYKFKFKTGFKLKILELKLLLNLGQIYWESKLIWKNLTNFPNFLFGMTFQIVNLDCHGCMAKTKVSIQAHMPLIPSNYKMKQCRLQGNSYSETRGVTL